MNINTGKIPVTLYTAAAILSLSIVVNLPGLAITPMLGTLSKVFPHTTQLEKQLLTVMPNLLIIPFVLLSGKLSLTPKKAQVVITGLIIYAAAGIAYLFARSMTELIIISCLIGVGAGLIIPFSTGFIADVFAGKYCMQQMGLQSGISNLTLVIATFAVGWLSHSNWHMPFLVYLLPLIPLAMSPGLRRIPAIDLVNPAQGGTQPASQSAPATATPETKGRFLVGRTVSLIFFYFFIGYSTLIISYYAPFLVEKKDWSSELTGTITSLYFLFMFLPGFLLPWIVKKLRNSTFLISIASMTAGLAIFAFLHEPWTMCVGAVLCGAGYGICQPLIYDKAPRIVSDPRLGTLALSLVLSANYLACVSTPFIVDGLRTLFHAEHVYGFSFLLNFSLLAIYFIIAILKRKSFCFSVPKAYLS